MTRSLLVLPLFGLLAGCPRGAEVQTPDSAGLVICPENGKQVREDGGREVYCLDRTGVKNGPFVEYHADNSVKLQGDYAFGKRAGPWVEFHPGGVQKKSEGTYDNGLRHGVWKYWFVSGQLWSEAKYKQGQEHGMWKSFFPTGRQEKEGVYLEGYEYGRWTTWFPNGQTASIGEYDAGDKKGDWKYWDEQGRPVTAEQFDALYR